MDESFYKQILYNVFINACKFNKKKGAVAIRVNVRRPICNDRKIILETDIEDHGNGMSSKKKKSLFKLFANVKQQVKNDEVG